MRRLSISLFFCLIAILCQAQVEHLKFMGIPLDGKINEFQSKLLKKGCTIDEFSMKYVKPGGARLYKGYFAGNSAAIAIFFNEKTKIVYRAKVVITEYFEDQVKRNYHEMKKLLIDKYDIKGKLQQKYSGVVSDSLINNYKWFFEDTEDKYESSHFYITDVDNFEELGTIDLFVKERESAITYKIEYTLHIDYIDHFNREADKDDRMNDL